MMIRIWYHDGSVADYQIPAWTGGTTTDYASDGTNDVSRSAIDGYTLITERFYQSSDGLMLEQIITPTPDYRPYVMRQSKETTPEPVERRCCVVPRNRLSSVRLVEVDGVTKWPLEDGSDEDDEDDDLRDVLII